MHAASVDEALSGANAEPIAFTFDEKPRISLDATHGPSLLLTLLAMQQ
jgi:hypothetical protein